MAYRFLQRIGTISAWTTVNPVLGLGEEGYETQTDGSAPKLKIGDGVHQWSALPYSKPIGTGAGTYAAGDDSRITGAVQKVSNLADLPDHAQSRLNLGLDTAATYAATAFDAAGAATTAVSNHASATDPHGDRAAAALLVDDLSGVTNQATARNNLGLGTAAITAASAYATATQGATADLAIAKATLNADGNLLTRIGGVPGQITRAALAADAAFTSKFVGAIVLVPSGDTSGVTDDAAFAAAKATLIAAGGGHLHFKKGVFYFTATLDLTALYNVQVTGEGFAGTTGDSNGTQLRMVTNNVPILMLWGNPVADNLCLLYVTQQTTANTAAIGLSMNNLSGAGLTNIRVWQANTSYGIPQGAFGATAYNILFNSSGRNLQSWKASETHFDLRNFNGGGTNCKFGPLYVNGGGSLDFVTPGQSADYAFRGNNWSGYEFGAISVDALELNQRVFDVDSGSNIFTIDTLRMEGVNCKADAQNLVVLGGADNVCHIKVFNIKNTKWTAATPTTWFAFFTRATRNILTVDTFRLETDCALGASGTRRAMQTTTIASAGSEVRFRSILDSLPALSDTVWNETTTNQTVVKEWNGRFISGTRQANRGNSNPFRLIAATAVPTTLTWAADDQVDMFAVAEGLPVAYRCITAGTPGTWRQIAHTVKKGTTAQRPVPGASDQGVQYFDTTLVAAGKPIWWHGTAWVDATGTVV